MNWQLTYIYHDCFLLDTEKAVVLFDYWKDPLASDHNKDFPPLLDLIDSSKQVYILVSHHHKDHFSRRIFLWADRFPNLHYILSPDTFKAVNYMFRENTSYRGPRPAGDSVVVLQRGETYKDEYIEIKAFGSTDIGNSYAVTIQGKAFFHAGDLNAWIWKDESSAEEVKQALTDYLDNLSPILAGFQEFEVAMFPVDSRLGTDYFLGAKIFVETFRVNYFLPMHFELVTEEEDKIPRRIDAARFNLYCNPERGSYLQLAATRASLLHN